MSGAIAVFFGTRPEIIKLAPLTKLLKASVRLIHTGQHFDRELSQVIFDDLGVSADTRNQGVGGSSRAQQIGRSVIGGRRKFRAVAGSWSRETRTALLPARFWQTHWRSPSPFGDGHASERMVASLERFGIM